MNGWGVWEDEYTAHVYDQNYDDMVALRLNKKDRTIAVENVILDEGGLERLRKRLQQAERYFKNNPPRE